jgi:RNA polymerase sigma factor (sigma-70 family)
MSEFQCEQEGERALLQQLRRSDPVALNELLEREWNELVGFAYRHTDSLENAEDIAQESFVRLWASRKEWNTNGSARAILYRIARNLAIDERRKRLVRNRTTNLDLPQNRTATPLEITEESELTHEFDAALEKLPEREREIFLLSRHQGLTYAEIAEVMQLAPQTVANLLHRVLDQLRRDLAPFLMPEPGTKVLSFPARQA